MSVIFSTLMSSFNSTKVLLLLLLICCISSSFFCLWSLVSESLTSETNSLVSYVRFLIYFLNISLTCIWYILRCSLLVKRTPRAYFFISPPSMPWVTYWLDLSLRRATISQREKGSILSFLNPRLISFVWMSLLLSLRRSASVPVTAFGF